MKIVTFSLTLFMGFSFFTGCITAKQIKGPTAGKITWSIECTGKSFTGTRCYEKASEVCPSGYNIIDSSSTDNRNQVLLIECK